MKKTPVVLACLLLFAASASMAMSLGRNRGAVLIGRTLDVSVPATMDAQEDPANLCVDADVFYADTRVDRSRVRVTTVSSTSAPQSAVIRIRAESVIDEPVVTIYLRAGCLQRSEKRFVMLADVVSETGNQSVPAAIVPVLPSTGSAVATPSSSARPAAPASPNTGAAAGQAAPQAPTFSSGRASRRASQRSAGQAVAADAPARVAVQAPDTGSNAPVKASARRKNEKTAAVAARSGKARLKLEPLDLTIDYDPTLRSSAEMLSTPAANEQERSVAAALWRALNAQPQDILKDAEKLRSLDASVRDLRNQTVKNQQAIGELNAELQKAQAERYANMLVYSLGILLLLALAALAYFWRQGFVRLDRNGDEQPWWRKSKPLERGWSNSLRNSGLAPMPEVVKATTKKQRVESPSSSGLDLDLGSDHPIYTEVKHMSGHGARDVAPPLSRRDQVDFAPSMSATPRALKAEELFDVQQQADFFVSLGQHEQAIEVLRSHIADNGPISALVYLDLFNLYHQLDRRGDYEALRNEFNQLFNARMPAFDVYTDSSPGLESYEAAMTRIEALWPSPKVLEVIEESIFRKPDAGGKAFDLEAYRELLLLYAVAREIISPESNKNDSLLSFDLPDSTLGAVDSRTSRFMATSIQPLSASIWGDRHDNTAPVSVSVLPPPSPRLGLDIDLSELHDDGEAAHSGTESDSDFFAQFVASLPETPETAPAATPPAKPGDDLGNLIDFDVFESPDDDSGSKKSPRD